MKNTAHNGIIYCRVSDPSQVQGTSLDNQKRACLTYAENKGIEIEEIFIEAGESATAANRTQFLNALTYCRANKTINAFIVWKIDRFARNTTDHFAVRAELQRRGITLLSVTEPITDDPQGKLMETLLAGYAEFENEVRKQRCMGGMQGRLREGIWPWWPPIGYMHSKKLHDRRKLLPDDPDPARFYLIQKALRAYATGNYNITQLAAVMNQWGFRTRQNKPMRKQLVEQMLTNKFYAGMLVDPWSGEEHHGRHKGMITSEEYYTIQAVKARLSNKATAKRLHVNPDFPLRGTVSCVCGVFLTAGWRKGRSARYPYYQCKNPMCAFFTHGIRKSHLEEQFLLFLESITLKDKILRVFKIALLEALKRDTTTNERDRRHYEQERTRLTARKEHLLQMRTDEEISKDEYLGLKRKVDIQLAALTASHTEVSFQDVDIETVISDVTKWMHSIARGWSKTNNTAKKQRLQKMVLPEGITYDKTSGAYCTAVLPCVFRLNRDFSGDESAFVAEVGRNSHRILEDLYDMWKLAQTQEPNEFAA